MKINLNRMIYLCGVFHDYRVVTSAFEGSADISVPTAAFGHAIVRALRSHAKERLLTQDAEHLFPPSKIVKGR